MEFEGKRTYLAGEALARRRRVKIVGSEIMYSDAGEEYIGLTQYAMADADYGTVREKTLGGTFEMTAAGAISVGARVYGAADGKISAVPAGKCIGIALEAATADGDIIETLPFDELVELNQENSVIRFKDDFRQYDPTATVGGYVVTEDAGADVGDALDATLPGGVLNVGCDGDDNDECYVANVVPLFKFQTNKKVFFECRVKLTEANADDANWCAGLCSVYAANTLVDNGAGMVTTFDGAMFYKVDGTMSIKFITSNGAVQAAPTTIATFVSGTWYTLGFLYDPGDGVTATITPYIDGVAKTAHTITIAGLDAILYPVFGVKAGGANEEGLKVDYVAVSQER